MVRQDERFEYKYDLMLSNNRVCCESGFTTWRKAFKRALSHLNRDKQWHVALGNIECPPEHCNNQYVSISVNKSTPKYWQYTIDFGDESSCVCMFKSWRKARKAALRAVEAKHPGNTFRVVTWVSLTI